MSVPCGEVRECAPALGALAEVEGAVREGRAALRGRLRVTSTTAFGRTHLLPVVADFAAAHPGMEVELSLSDRFVDLVAEGFDLAIRGGVPPVNEYVSRLVLSVAMLVCASPAYAEHHGLPRAPDEIDAHRLVGMRSNPSQEVFAWEFAAPGGGGGVLWRRIAPAFVVNDPERAALAAAAGMGLAQVGSNIVLPKVAAGRLVLALEGHAVRARGLYAVYPSRRFVPRRLTAFVVAVADAFAQRPDLVWSRSPRLACDFGQTVRQPQSRGSMNHRPQSVRTRKCGPRHRNPEREAPGRSLPLGGARAAARCRMRRARCACRGP